MGAERKPHATFQGLASLRSTIAARPVRFVCDILTACVFAAGTSLLGSFALERLTNGRGAIWETLPWFALGTSCAGVFWVVWRLNRSRDATKASLPTGNVSTAREQRPTRAGPDGPESPPSPETLRQGIVFISYRRADSGDVTGRIYDRLVQPFGRDGVFKDVDSIPIGVDFRDHLTAAVAKCRVFIAIIGPGWERSGNDVPPDRDYVRAEIEAALARKVPIFPVLVQGAQMPEPEKLPPSLEPLAYVNAHRVRPDPDFHSDVDKLLHSIKQLLKGSRGA